MDRLVSLSVPVDITPMDCNACLVAVLAKPAPPLQSACLASSANTCWVHNATRLAQVAWSLQHQVITRSASTVPPPVRPAYQPTFHTALPAPMALSCNSANVSPTAHLASMRIQGRIPANYAFPLVLPAAVEFCVCPVSSPVTSSLVLPALDANCHV